MAEMKRDVRSKWDVETVKKNKKKNMISNEAEPLQTAHAEDLVLLGERETGSGVDSYSGGSSHPVFRARNPIMSLCENFWV